MILQGDGAKDSKGNDEKHHIVIEALSATAPGLPCTPAIETTTTRLTERILA